MILVLQVVVNNMAFSKMIFKFLPLLGSVPKVFQKCSCRVPGMFRKCSSVFWEYSSGVPQVFCESSGSKSQLVTAGECSEVVPKMFRETVKNYKSTQYDVCMTCAQDRNGPKCFSIFHSLFHSFFLLISILDRY